MAIDINILNDEYIINFPALYMYCGAIERVAKSMSTKLIRKFNIEHEFNMIRKTDLLIIKEYFTSRETSKYKMKMLEIIDMILNDDPNTPSKVYEVPKTYYTVDPFKSFFVLEQLVEYLKETQNLEALAYYEKIKFESDNYVSQETPLMSGDDIYVDIDNI